VRICREGGGFPLAQIIQGVSDPLDKTSEDNPSEKLSEASRIRQKANLLLEALEARGFFERPGDPGALQKSIQMHESIDLPDTS
jgi:hypothetical protein